MPMSNSGLSKLVEELGELQQVAGKMLAYGIGDHPDGKGNLLKRFEEETGDVLAAIEFVTRKLGANHKDISDREFDKLDIFIKWDSES